MKFKPILYIAIGCGLYFLSKQLELQGDAAPVEGDVSPERARYHIMALVALLSGIGFFIAGGVSAVRQLRG